MLVRVFLATALTLSTALVCVRAQAPETFGADVSLTETTPLVRLLDQPADFEGKTVRVEGRVTAVCMHMGCWMALTPEASSDSRTMLIKVDDGVIVFPPSAKGRRAVAQGVIERIGGSRRRTGSRSRTCAQYWSREERPGHLAVEGDGRDASRRQLKTS
jgi:hypothetical protein